MRRGSEGGNGDKLPNYIYTSINLDIGMEKIIEKKHHVMYTKKCIWSGIF